MSASHLQLNTEYKNEFIDKEVPVQRGSARPQDFPQASGKFDPSTTYGGDFKTFGVERTAPAKPQHSTAVEGLPFEGTSNYKANFGPKTVPYERMKPRSEYQPNKV